MRAIHTLLAQLPDDFAPRKFSLTSGSRELVVVIGAVVLVSGMAIIWALFIRKKPRHHHHSHSHHTSSNPANSATKAEGSQPDTGEGSRRRRRRRRKEPPRNPTLAETGGLPPLRGDEPPEPHG